MRKFPFEPAAFDAVVSAYAIDHLNRQGVNQSLAEAARVVKPGGDFLPMVIANDPWANSPSGRYSSTAALAARPGGPHACKKRIFKFLRKERVR